MIHSIFFSMVLRDCSIFLSGSYDSGYMLTVWELDGNPYHVSCYDRVEDALEDITKAVADLELWSALDSFKPSETVDVV